MKMKALQVQQGSVVVLKEEAKIPKDMVFKRKVNILARAHNIILLSLIEEVLGEVVDQISASTLWENVCDK